MILCHPHGSGELSRLMEMKTCNIRKWLLTQCRICTLLVLLRGAIWGVSCRETPRRRIQDFIEDSVISQKAPFPDIQQRDSPSSMLYIKRCYQTTVLGSNFFFVLSLIYTYRLVRLLPPHCFLLDSCAAPLHLSAQH